MIINSTRNNRARHYPRTKRATPKPLVGIVSMVRDGSVSQPVRFSFKKLGYKYNIYKYDTHDLYNKIQHGEETHWFFTGNTHDFVTEIGAPYIDQRIYTIRNKMFLFVCYSHQLAALNAGAIIYTMNERIIRNIKIQRLKADPIFKGLPDSQEFFAYYKQFVHTDQQLEHWKLLARAGNHSIIMKNGCNMYSIQVHPERLDATLVFLDNWLNMSP